MGDPGGARAAVLALAIKWRSEAPTPVFTELQIPKAVEQDKETGREGDKDGDAAGKAMPR